VSRLDRGRSAGSGAVAGLGPGPPVGYPSAVARTPGPPPSASRPAPPRARL